MKKKLEKKLKKKKMTMKEEFVHKLNLFGLDPMIPLVHIMMGHFVLALLNLFGQRFLIKLLRPLRLKD